MAALNQDGCALVAVTAVVFAMPLVRVADAVGRALLPSFAADARGCDGRTLPFAPGLGAMGRDTLPVGFAAAVARVVGVVAGRCPVVVFAVVVGHLVGRLRVLISPTAYHTHPLACRIMDFWLTVFTISCALFAC